MLDISLKPSSQKKTLVIKQSARINIESNKCTLSFDFVAIAETYMFIGLY